MEALYEEALNYHIYSVTSLVIMITAFYLFTQLAKDITLYKKRIRLWMPIYIVALFFAIFTGVLMMAAKHLEFTFANNLMIILALFLLFLELKRHKYLKRITEIQDTQLNLIKLIYAVELLSAFMVVYLMKSHII